MRQTAESAINAQLETEYRPLLSAITLWVVLPSAVLFWIADCLFVPDLKWTLLQLRLLDLPICFFALYGYHKFPSKYLEPVSSIFIVSLALVVNVIIIVIGTPATAYYAGLTLISFGGLTIFPYSKTYFWLTVAGVYLPYYTFALLTVRDLSEARLVVVNSFFIVTSIVLCIWVRHFQDFRRKGK